MHKLDLFARQSTHTFLWVSLFLLALAIQPTLSSGPQRELLDSTPIQAASSSFWDTGMRLCDVDDQGNCHNSKYALSIARFGLGGAVAAFLSLVAFIIFLPVRCMCNGFGGKNTSYGICPSESDKREYTRNEILSVKVVVCIFVIPIIIGVAIGFKANSDISSSVDSITTTLVESGDSILTTLLEVKSILLSLPITSSSASIINSAVSTATTIDNHMHNAHDVTNKYDHIRESLMIIGFVFSLVIMFAGVVSVIFNLRLLALILGVIGFITLTVVWLSFGIHLVAGKFTFDVCTDITIITSNNTAVSDQTSVFKTGALANLWECDNNTQFALLETLVNQSISIAASGACDARAAVCFNASSGSGDPDWVCSNSPPCGPNTLSVVVDRAHLVIMDNGVNRSLSECALSCTDANNRNFSITLEAGVNLYTNYTTIYYTQLLPIITCQVAVDVLLELKGPLCGTLFDSLYGVAVSNLIMGIFYVPFIILMVVGFKRFQSLDGGIV